MIKNFDDLEGEGFIFNILNYLWMKNPFTLQSMQMHLPPTILIKNGEPKLWYQSIDGFIKKKQNSKLDSDIILQSFCKNTLPQIVCMFVQPKAVGNQMVQFRFQYMDRESLKEFFEVNKQNYNLQGYLQKFVVSKGDENFVIKVRWSKNLFFAQKLTNKNPLKEKKRDIYQKVLTFQSIKFSESKPIKSKALIKKLESICRDIHLHIFNVTNNQVDIMQFQAYMKLSLVGRQERVYFLFCSMIHLFQKPGYQLGQIKKKPQVYADRKARGKAECFYEIPDYINKNKLFRKECIKLKRNYQCQNCQHKIDEEQISQIEYDKIIKSWQNTFYEHKPVKESQNPKIIEIAKNFKLPKYFQINHPKITLNQFYSKINNQKFRLNKARICEDCYLDFMSKANYSQTLQGLTDYVTAQARVCGIKQPKMIIRTKKYPAEKRVQSQGLNRRIIHITDQEMEQYRYKGLKRRYADELRKIQPFLQQLKQQQLANCKSVKDISVKTYHSYNL